MAGDERSTVPGVALMAPPSGGGGLIDSLLGQMCCCNSETQQSLGVLDIQGALSQGQDSFMKDFSMNDSNPDQMEEAEKVDKDLTRGMQSAGKDGLNPLRMQLLAAVRNDDAPGVLQHVADGADIGLMGEALRLASHRGSSSVVRELVAVGLSVNEACPQTHFTPIHLASAGGHHVVCEVLLDALADVHRPIAGTTALSMARKSGHAEVEEVITRHITSLVMNDQGEASDNPQANRRAHVLPRVSPFLSEAVLQALPAPAGHQESNDKDASKNAAAVAAAPAAAVEAPAFPTAAEASSAAAGADAGTGASPGSVDNSGRTHAERQTAAAAAAPTAPEGTTAEGEEAKSASKVETEARNPGESL